MEIIQERLEREFDLDLIATAPSVIYKVITTKGEELWIQTPRTFPLLRKYNRSMNPS